MPNRDGDPRQSGLHLRIDELESLLAEARGTPAADEARIPVLDEEVTATGPAPATPPQTPPPVAPAGIPPRPTPRQLADLAQRLQHRLDAELEDLADVIRNVVKRCILEELRKELPPAGGAGTPKPGTTDRH